MTRRQAMAKVASALAVLAGMPSLGGCDTPRLILRQMCVQQCEQEGQRFEDMERCRADCRDAYEGQPDGG